MKKKTISKCIISGIILVMLTGCGNAIPELTEEEASLVATYAADTLLEHSRQGGSRLIDTQKEAERLKKLEEKTAEIHKEITEEEAEAEQEAVKAMGAGSAGMQSIDSMSSFLGLDGFAVSYAGYEIEKSYPSEGQEWEFVIDATQGTNLLVVKLNVTNTGSTPAVLDMLSKDVHFHIDGVYGDGETVGMTTLWTMLLNDLAFAQDEIGAGESREYVLIIQIEENITELDSLSLYIRNGEKSMTVKLQ